MAVYKDRLYFVADDPHRGPLLWTSDGTPQGTRVVIDPVPATAAHADPTFLRVAGPYLYFVAPTPAHGVELWKSDGTTARHGAADRSGPRRGLSRLLVLLCFRQPSPFRRRRRQERPGALGHGRDGQGDPPADQLRARRGVSRLRAGLLPPGQPDRQPAHLPGRRRRPRLGALDDRRHAGRYGSAQGRLPRLAARERALSSRPSATAPCSPASLPPAARSPGSPTALPAGTHLLRDFCRGELQLQCPSPCSRPPARRSSCSRTPAATPSSSGAPTAPLTGPARWRA